MTAACLRGGDVVASIADQPAEPSPSAALASLGRVLLPEPRLADALRALASEAVHQAGVARPGMPIGMADVATVLWTRFLTFDAADPLWPDRDRFVLSPGHRAALLHGLLHLTGHAGLAIVPDHAVHSAIETAAGLPGQGIANAVGMALAERLLAARFGRSLVDHRTWGIVGDADLMEGLSHEAASLAGHLRLERLTVLWDDAALDDRRPAQSDDPLKRFAACGWAVKRIDGHDVAEIEAALSMAQRARKPTFIACRTVIGLGGLRRPAAAAVPGASRGPAEAEAARTALDRDRSPFVLPEGVAERWLVAGARGARARRAWLKRLANHPQRAEFERAIAGHLPVQFREAAAALRAELARRRPRRATQAASQRVLEAFVPAIPELVGGTAAAGANPLPVKGMGMVAPGSFAGRHLDFGSRAHGMAAAMNGMALHGGIIPYGGAGLVSADFMRPAIRLAALARRRVIHVATQDGSGLGEGGPAQQPVEHLASLRAMPNLHVFRPADALETVECWELALRRADGPSLLVLSQQALPALRGDAGENRCGRGGYVLAEANGPRQATLIATGPEVAIALAARDALAGEGIKVAVVSLPCWELFAAQDPSWRESVLGGAPRLGVEAAGSFGWERWLGPAGVFIGLDRVGAGGANQDGSRGIGITAEAVAAAVRRQVT
jgi:transketolase